MFDLSKDIETCELDQSASKQYLLYICFFIVALRLIKKCFCRTAVLPPPTPPVPPSSSLLPKIRKIKLGLSTWKPFSELLINLPLLAKGIVVVTTPGFSGGVSLASDCGFRLSSRQFLFGGQKVNPSKFSSSKKVFALLNKLKTVHVLSNNEKELKQNSEIGFYNPERRDEIFLPLTVPRSNQQETGFYVYPWASRDIQIDEFKPSGFERFVTAVCMFGGNIRGINQKGWAYPLIKHNHDFFPEEKIVCIAYNPQEANPYEEMVFQEFEEQAFLIDSLSKSNPSKSLYCHLPFYDYMLLGLGLFLRGRMTSKALNQFFAIILLKKVEYKERLAIISESHKIKLVIESPFENLLGDLKLENVSESQVAQSILQALKLPAKEITTPLGLKEQAATELKFVSHCMELLRTKSYNALHQKVWGDFGILIGKTFSSEGKEVPRLDRPTNLESLFKVSNALFVALASVGQKDYQTCILLPVSEEQTLLSYQLLSRYLSPKVYPTVFYLTILDPIIGYDTTDSNGLLFYFTDCKRSLAQLIVEQGILRCVHENIAHISTTGLCKVPICLAEADSDTNNTGVKDDEKTNTMLASASTSSVATSRIS